MGKKRTRLEVINDLLEIIKKYKQARITQLIYKANLSNNSIKPYIKELLEQALITETVEKEKKFYALAAKGEEFLIEYKKIKIFSESYGL